MNVLAIDASTDKASVAVKAGDKLFCLEQDSVKTHAQLMLPMIERLMVQADVQLNQLDGIVFGCGPGSFTGLRIACSIAKGLAFAHDLHLIPVSSLAALAWAAREQEQYSSLPVLAVIDARMNELYWAYFAPDVYTAQERVTPVQLIDVPVDSLLLVAGTGIDNYWPDCTAELKERTPIRLNLTPNAGAMIRLAEVTHIQAITAAQAQPVYVRNQVTQGT